MALTVDQSTHLQYTEFSDAWRTVRDCVAGRAAILAGGDRYLPMLESHRNNPRKYAQYQTRACFLGAPERVLSALSGTVLRKDPSVKLPRRLDPLLLNADSMGGTIYTVASRILRELISIGRVGVLVDRPRDGGVPYFMTYTAEQIRNWRWRRVGGQSVLDLVILEEWDATPTQFGEDLRRRFRVLKLDDETGNYTVSVWERVGDKSEYVEVDWFEPRPTGRPIDYLPFVFMNPNDLSPSASKPPMLDLCDVALAHFRNSADIEAARHALAFPVPVLVGVDSQEGATWEVGGDQVWQLPLGASATMLEFRGDGLGSLERAMAEKERWLAALGARLLEPQKRDAESAEALGIRQSADTASLAAIAKTESDGLTRCLNIAAAWETATGEAALEMNQDFYDRSLPAADIRELLAAHMSGALTLTDFIWNLQQGERVRPGRSIEEIKDELRSEPPVLLGQAVDLGDEPVQEAAE